MLLNDHIAEVNPNAEPNPALLGHLRFTIGHSALDFDSATDGIHNTRKLRQEAIAGVLDDATPVLRDLWIDQFREMRLEPLVRAFLIRSHQA